MSAPGIRQSSIVQLVESACDGRLNLPLFQRKFEWDSDRVVKLLDSLLKGYPIGTFLVWDNTGYTYARADSRYRMCDWLVDGQQRMTALCNLYNKRPIWWEGRKPWRQLVKDNQVWINIRTEDIRLSSRPDSKDRVAWASVSEILSLTSDDEIRNFVDRVANVTVKEDRKRNNLEDLAREKSSVDYSEDISEENEEERESGGLSFYYDSYKNSSDLARRIEPRIRKVISVGGIPVPQLVTRHPPSDMATIFARLNSLGMSVSSTDIFLALLASALPKWVKDEFRPFCLEIERSGLIIDPSIYVKALTGYALKRADLSSLISQENKRSLNMRELSDYWKTVREAIIEVLHGLQGHGVLSEKVIPSKNTLVPLIVMRSMFDSSFNISQALNWFMKANYGRYQQASNYYLNQDLETIHRSSNFIDARNSLMESMDFEWKFYDSEFDVRPTAKKAYQLVIYLTLYDRGSRDWFTGDRIAFTHSSRDWIAGYKPEWHHIFPKARLKSQRAYPIRNSFANLTAVNEKTNRKIRDSLPIDYFRGDIEGMRAISKKQLRAHMIPTEEEFWYLGKFPDFVKERARLLTRGINSFIRSLE